MNWNIPLALGAAYLLGAIPFGYMIYRWTTGRDIRKEGSGNIGATNVTRVLGPVAGLITLVLDVAKGYLAVMLASWAGGGHRGWMSAGAVAVLLGHMYPVFLGFRGGKGVASALGAFVALAPHAVLAALVVWTAVVAVWRFVALGSVAAVALFPLAAWLVDRPTPAQTLGTVVAAVLIILRHSRNVRRLLSGTEGRLEFRRLPRGSATPQ